MRDKSGKTKNGFVWTFGARDDDGGLDIAYVFTEDRSGETPKKLLEGTKGVLLVDGYSGYNIVDEVSSRRRAACHAHLRRYFHEALPTAPVAQEMLDLVAELYIAEHAADAQGLLSTSKLEFRKARAGPVRARMRAWLGTHKDRHPPKSPIATAIRYAENRWEELGVFLDDTLVPLDSRVGDRRGGAQASLGCVRRFQLRARLGFAIAPFPVPATSNRTGGFPASGSPRGCHHIGVMVLFRSAMLSRGRCSGSRSRRRDPTSRTQPRYSTASNRSPSAFAS